MNLSEARRISRCAGGDSLAHYTDDTAVTVEHCNDGTFIGLLREADAELGGPDVQAFIWWGPPRRPRLTHQHVTPAGPGVGHAAAPPERRTPEPNLQRSSEVTLRSLMRRWQLSQMVGTEGWFIRLFTSWRVRVR